MRRIRLAIVITHPIQYYVPVFRGLSHSPQLDVRVFYTWSQAEQGNLHEPGFGTTVRWDLPLRDGYEHEFVANVARRPGLHGFWGVRTPTLAARILEWQADALLVYGWNLASHLGAMRALHGRVPIFFRGDSTLLDPQAGWRDALRRVALTGIYRYVDYPIAVGANSRDYFRWCGVSEERIEYAPHSVDTTRFAADDAAQGAAAEAWRRELGIPAEAVVFGFAGKFLAKKDPLLLIEAFKATGRDAHLALFGGGPLENEVRARAAQCPRIHVLPFQNQTAMPAAYRLADVFVLPSRGPGETWGLVLNEAMACGRAVVASSRVGGARDLVVPGETGWTFPAGDVNALRVILAEILALPRPRIRALGEQARQHVRRFSTEECVTRTAEAITRRVGSQPYPLRATGLFAPLEVKR
jgi:glycosyltransferase involved in cell wall biosynthesis